MSTQTDQELITTLRARADAGPPQMSLDGSAVRAKGRRLLRGRRSVGVGAGLAVAVVVVSGTLTLFAPRPALSPADPAHTAVSETRANLAAGVTAATAATGSSSPWGTGLTVTLPAGTYSVDLVAGTDADLQEVRQGTGVQVDHALRIAFSGAGAPTTPAMFA